MAWKPTQLLRPPSVGWLQPRGESGGSSETVVILFGLTQLLTTVANPGNVPDEDCNGHRLARCIVERTIWRWKMCFRCLHKFGKMLRSSVMARACPRRQYAGGSRQ
ncbi:unnamed protein product [Arctogadus glacialis]